MGSSLVFLLGFLGILLGPASFISWVAWRAKKRTEQTLIAQLANPILNDIPLPPIHDERWVRRDVKNPAHEGLHGEYVMGRFHLSGSQFVYLDGTEIGEWKAYVVAVSNVMRRRELAMMQAKAIKQIAEAPQP